MREETRVAPLQIFSPDDMQVKLLLPVKKLS